MAKSPRITRQLAVVVWLVSLSWIGPAGAQSSNEVETVLVYKPDGTLHCEATEGVSLDAMAEELVQSGISVHARRKSHDGREGIAVCGSPTGGINVYEIAASDLPRALELGFRRLDPAWLDGPTR